MATLVLVDVLPSLLTGDPVFLTPEQITRRLPTALIAFALAMATQWARARGVDAMATIRNIFGGE